MLVDINLVLLLVELVLLAPTLLLILLGRREEKGRVLLLKGITKTAKMVSRQEYFNNVQFGIQNANLTIRGAITGSLPQDHEQDEVIINIADQIKRARRRGVTIQYLLVKSHNRLPIAARYHLAGAEIRFHSSLLVSDIRYVVFDQKYVLIGLPIAAGENEPTREGYLIPSEGLAQIFLQQFEAKWAQAIEYVEYLKEVLLEMRHENPNASTALVSSQLGIPESEVTRIYSLCKTQKNAIVDASS